MDADPTDATDTGRRHGVAFGMGMGLAIGAVIGMVLGTLLGAGVAVLVLRTSDTHEKASAEERAVEEPADVADPQTLEREGFALQFPGNWRVASEEDDFDPDAYFSIDSPGGSYVTIELVDEEIAVDEEVRACVAEFVPEWIVRPDKEAFTAWGAYEGLGLQLSGRTVDGEDGGVRIFAHSGDRGAFIVVEVYYDADHDHTAPGFDLIRKSFKLRMQGQPSSQGSRL